MIDRSFIRWFLRGALGMGLLLVLAGGLCHPQTGRAGDLTGGGAQGPAATLGEGRSASGAGQLRTQDYQSPMILPAAAFTPDGLPTREWRFHSEGYLYSNANCAMITPLLLPDGVTITSVYATIMDSSTTDDVGVHLYRTHNTTGVTQKMASFTSDPLSGGFYPNVGTSDIDYAQIDHPTYAYWVGISVEGGSGNRLYAVRVDYE